MITDPLPVLLAFAGGVVIGGWSDHYLLPFVVDLWVRIMRRDGE